MLVSPLKPRSRKANFGKLEVRLKLVKTFWERSSETRLLANSSPARLLTLRSLASRFVNVSRSWTVNGPAGFARAARIAAFNPASGMDTSCAGTDVTPTRDRKINANNRGESKIGFIPLDNWNGAEVSSWGTVEIVN